jgi:hypothetical protein
MDSFTLLCEHCGREIILIKKEGSQKSYVLRQKCFLCGETHISRTTHKAMWTRKLFSFGCEVSGYDMCYIGESDDVSGSLEKLMAELNELSAESETEADVNISDALSEAGYIMIAFELLKTYLAEGKVRCTCDDNRFIVRMTDGGIGLSCGGCGSFHEIKCKTSEDVENFKKTDILLLQKD